MKIPTPILDVGAEATLKEKLNISKLLADKLTLEELAHFLKKYIKNKKIIFLAGAEGSGKSTLVEKLGFPYLDTDDFLKGDRNYRKSVNDEREACDFITLLVYAQKISTLKNQETLHIPRYNQQTGLALDGKPYTERITGTVNTLLIGGCLDPFEGALWQAKQENVNQVFIKPDTTIYLYVSDEDRYKARLHRDVTQGMRGLTEEALLEQFNTRQVSQLKTIILDILKKANVVIVGKRLQNPEIHYMYDIYESN